MRRFARLSEFEAANNGLGRSFDKDCMLVGPSPVHVRRRTLRHNTCPHFHAFGKAVNLSPVAHPMKSKHNMLNAED